LLAHNDSAALIEAAGSAGVLAADDARALAQAHAALLARALTCTLDARPRLVARDAALDAHSTAVLRIAHALGLDFRPVGN